MKRLFVLMVSILILIYLNNFCIFCKLLLDSFVKVIKTPET